ncbi:recombinase family protein [Shewanella glacialipiscicola]|uniref:recombinase family protein n=1 Tax=Shewanella TaxID=22 RepID=UPI003D78E4D9
MKCFGYVSGADALDCNMQRLALNSAGCDLIYADTAGRDKRKQLFNAMAEGDKLIIWRLDKLASSVKDLSELLELIKNKGVSFYSIQERLNADLIDSTQFKKLVDVMVEIEKNAILSSQVHLDK